ncbi:hypothetical protein TNCV_3159011 [Trichonephila clavipes]|nr:hypothetical protein TNCV_3159011 [Trichonephila clavipes]
MLVFSTSLRKKDVNRRRIQNGVELAFHWVVSNKFDSFHPQPMSEHDFAAPKATDHDVVGDEIENNSANAQTLVKSIKSKPNSPVASTSKDGVIRCPTCEEEYCDPPTEEWMQCC